MQVKNTQVLIVLLITFLVQCKDPGPTNDVPQQTCEEYSERSSSRFTKCGEMVNQIMPVTLETPSVNDAYEWTEPTDTVTLLYWLENFGEVCLASETKLAVTMVFKDSTQLMFEPERFASILHLDFMQNGQSRTMLCHWQNTPPNIYDITGVGSGRGITTSSPTFLGKGIRMYSEQVIGCISPALECLSEPDSMKYWTEVALHLKTVGNSFATTKEAFFDNVDSFNIAWIYNEPEE